MTDVTHAPARDTAPSPPPAPRGWRDRSIVQLTLVRLREFFREPEAVFWTFGFPLVLAGGLAVAFRNKPAEAVPIGVVTGVAGGERAVASLKGTAGLVVDVLPLDSAERALRTGSIAVLVVPKGDSAVEYRFDKDRAEARTARLVADDALQHGAGRADPVKSSEMTIAEPGARYIDFFIPGLLAMNIMGSSIWSLAFGIVTQRNKKLLKRLAATPMSRLEYLLSFVLSRLVFLGLEIAVLLGFGVAVLGVPIRGALPSLVLVAFVGAAAFGAIGLLVSSRARTVEGVSGLTNFVMMPMWIFSGVFFSSSNFPAVIQPVVQALPLTALVNGLRAIMLQGAGLGSVLPQLAVLAAYLVVSLAVALRIFRWQ
jgi:ABC-type multidrug transport system permease subunit